MRTFLLVLLMLASPAVAQVLPARFQVVNVALDDTLNIRAQPNAGAEIIGELDPVETGIEVIRISNDGGWGRVAMGEVSGWVSMRFLEHMEEPPTEGIRRPMRCVGSEPDWILQFEPDAVYFSTLDVGPLSLDVVREAMAGPDGMAVLKSEGNTLFTVMIARGFCSDGMSDREYGFRNMIFVESPGENILESGCCTLDLR